MISWGLYSLSGHQLAAAIKAMPRFSLVWTLVNALFWSTQMKYDRLWQQKLCLDRPDLVGSTGMKCQRSRHAKTIVT